MDLLPLPSDSTEDACYTTMSNSSSELGQYRPSPRYSHCTAIFNDHLYLWGGMQADLPSDHISELKLELISVVDTLSLKTGDWEQHKTYGTPPLGVYASSCTSLGERIFYFGGHCGHENCYHDSLHSLDPSRFQWSQLIPANPDSTPMGKAWCGMVGFKEGDTEFLCMFGGLGLLPESFSELQCTPDEVDPTFGWTNEIHLFSLKETAWQLPTVIGEAPPPCDAFTLTSIGENKAAMYGGGTAKYLERLSDLYLLEMESKQMTWSRLQSSGPQPSGRRLHAAACISGSLLEQAEPLLFTGGGIGGKKKALSDYWILNFKSGKWEQVALQGSVANFLKRMGHTMSAMTLGCGYSWIVLVGGVSQWDRSKPEHAQPFCSSRIFKIVLELVRDTDGQWSVTRIPSSKHHVKLMERLWQQTTAQHIPSDPAADTEDASLAAKPSPNINTNYHQELDVYLKQLDREMDEFASAVQQLDEGLLQLETAQLMDKADSQYDDEAYEFEEEEIRQSENEVKQLPVFQSYEAANCFDEAVQQSELESRSQVFQQPPEVQWSDREVQQLDEAVQQFELESRSQVFQQPPEVQWSDREVQQLDEAAQQSELESRSQVFQQPQEVQWSDKEVQQLDDEAQQSELESRSQVFQQPQEVQWSDEEVQQLDEEVQQSELESRSQVFQQPQEVPWSDEEVQQLDGKEVQPSNEHQQLDVVQQSHRGILHSAEEVLHVDENEVQNVDKNIYQLDNSGHQLNEEANCFIEGEKNGKQGEKENEKSVEQLNQIDDEENPQRAEHSDQEFEQLSKEVEQLNEEVMNLQQVLLVSENRVEIADRRALDAEQQALDSAYLVEALKQQLLAVEQQVEAATLRAQEAEQRALMAEHQVQFHPVTWIVQREQIEMTEREIGRGHWTKVKIAKFRQTVVAAKCLHQVILSKDNIQQFSREMYTSALLRHPNIIRFIGAVSAGEAIVLLELMPTSLRNELQKLVLSVSVIRTIGRDVAQALNYLHQWKPYPILHKDVSSSNVLLEPLGCSNWRAKLSDHGTTNFLRMMVPQDWGVYSPPEAEQPQDHSTKMDVYSFGVLLAEMCVNQFPPATHEDKLKLINTIQWPNLKVVAQWCTNKNPSKRPSIALAVSNL